MEEIEKLQDKEETEKNIITTLLLTINIIIWSVILIVAIFFMNIIKVNAQSIDYDNTTNYIHKTNGTAEWIQFPRATDYTLNTLNTYDQINLQWTNYQSGVANGVARFEITSISLLTQTCNQLYESIRIQENGNTINVPIQRKSCIRDTNSNYILVEVGFVTSLLGTNSYFEVQFRNNIQIASKVRAYGVMTVNSIDPATNTDIQDQTNALINNNNSNTQIITNAVENSTTNIINQIQDNLKLCENYNYTNTPIKDQNKYLNEQGLVLDLTGNNVSDYVPLSKNQTYILSVNYSSAQNGRSYCIYKKDKTLISCQRYTQASFTITPTEDGYIRYTINKTANNLTTDFTGRYCQDRTQAEIEELKVLQNLMHTEPWTHVTPDISDFEDMEEAEDELHTYTNVDLENIDFDIDSDTNSWVWNTLTRFLNSNIQVMGFVITLLSIGVIKLVLGR